MNPPAQTISDPPPDPNEGLRPYKQGEQAVFFDRKQDAARLKEKVLSARFTVLYGPAGVGKSFVLLNLLVPDLEKQNACVIYFKDWQSDDPTSELKAKFVAEAEKLKIPEPGAGRPSLTDLVRLLLISGDRTVVLILDQFEEFLGVPAGRQDLLRLELGMLANTPDLNVKVLLSLREQEKEKHLASLESLQATIPNLLQSTYRLAPAPYVGMRPFMRGEEAIFSGRDRDAALLRDKVFSARLTILYGLSGVGKSSILHLLLTPLLEKEGARVIYFDKWRGEDPLALLANRLVKAASLTISEPGGERPSLTELVRLMLKAENRSVVLILDQFEEFFLDAPSDRLEALRCELGQLLNTSDLDVRVLLSLREEHLAALEPFRSTILNLFQSTHRLGHLTGPNAREAIEGPVKHFGAQYDPEDPDLINILLKDLRQEQPAAKPGLPVPEIDAATPVDLPILQLIGEELWKETIVREAGKKTTGEPAELGPITITQRLYQQELKGRSGIQDRYLRRVMPDHWRDKKVTAQLMKPLAPRSGHKRAFSAGELSEETKLPLERVQSELERLSGPEVRVLRSRKYGAGPVLYELCHDSFISVIAPWRDDILWRAQLWFWSKLSIGILLVLSVIVLLINVVLIEKITEEIRTTEVLLGKVGENFPQTVAEARAVRGSWLPQDYRNIWKKQDPADLPTLMDILANYPDGSSADIKDKVLSELGSGPAFLPVRLRGPNKAGRVREIHPADQESPGLLPAVNPPIRVYLGKRLVTAWVRTNDLGPELKEQMGKIRDRIMRRYGIMIPGVRFRDSTFDPGIGDNAFRIEILNQHKDKKNPGTEQVDVGEGESLKRLVAALLLRAESYRSSFLTAEDVNSKLQNMRLSLREWLQKKYSLTDLKLLLRGVINPIQEELDERASAFKAGDLDRTFNVPTENTIRQPEWLLASLVFWSQVHDPYSLKDMTSDLRGTQRARINGNRDVLKNPRVFVIIEAGVQALNRGRLSDAEDAFGRAVASDPDAAAASFLVLYPQELRRSLLRKLTAASLEESESSQADRIELEDLVAEEDLDNTAGPRAARHLRLLQLATSSKTSLLVRKQLAENIVERYSRPELWPPEEAAWFGKSLLAWFDLLAEDDALPRKGLYFLKSALPRLSDPKVIDQYADYLIKRGIKSGPNQWCWELLRTLPKSRMDSGTALFIADYQAAREGNDGAEHALALVRQVRKNLQTQEVDPGKRTQLLNWADFLEAAALLRLAESGEVKGTAVAEKMLLKLKGSEVLGNLPARELAGLRRRENRPEEAAAILDEAMRKSPDAAVDLYREILALRLSTGDQNGVIRLTDEALSKIKKDSNGKVTEATKDFAFLAAEGLLVTKTEGWEKVSREFLQTDHVNAPYIAMILYWRLAGEDKAAAQSVIAGHWDPDKRGMWRKRLRQGDRTVWKEMLIGYYLGQVSRKEIFGDLEDEDRFARSDLRQVPKTRRSMLCEAYFYDALLADSNGDKDRSNSSLKKVVATNVADYDEYNLAKFLLAQQSKSK
ncbi:MAG: nSTAND1 domain-containing NTPase [Desulfobaccales bacterium]